jgi:uncharacterized protein (TIGR02300 family)
MAKDLGKKHTCYSCQAKFYDLGKPQAICPKCGANQKDAEDAHPAPSSRSRRAAAPVEVPVIEEEFEDQPEAAEEEEDEPLVAEESVVEEEAEDDDDEEEYDE